MKTNTFISSHHSATSSINKRGGSQNDRTQIRVLAFLKSIFVILLAASCLTMFNSTVSADRNPDITYTLDLNSLGRTNSVRVNMKISVDPKEKLVQVQMPVWSPGDYHVQNHAQYIMGLTAEGTDIMEIT